MLSCVIVTELCGARPDTGAAPADDEDPETEEAQQEGEEAERGGRDGRCDQRGRVHHHVQVEGTQEDQDRPEECVRRKHPATEVWLVFCVQNKSELLHVKDGSLCAVFNLFCKIYPSSACERWFFMCCI